MIERIKHRGLLVFAHDTAAASMAWIAAYLLRFNFAIPAEFMHSMLHSMVWIVPLQAIVFWRFGLYRGVWRFASIPDLKQILMAAAIAVLGAVAALFIGHFPEVVPRSVLVLDPILLVLMMGGSRFIYRAWREHQLYGTSQLQGEPVLVLGAGEAAVALLKDLERSSQWRVVGLLDDKSSMHGRLLQGIKILGILEDIPKVAAELAVRHVIVAMPSARHQLRRQALDLATNAGLTVFTVPAIEDLVSGKLSVSTIRKVEVEDLLGREPIALDEVGLHGLIEHRIIMITGAGGSIGSELCRQIAKFQPALLIFFELSEFALYALEQEFAQIFPSLQIACVVGDVKDGPRLDGIMSHYSPDVVFHAAAYKHVPMMENGNACEALRNNALGTFRVVEACIAHGIEKFVLVSTDKAVNPTNVMGASKRLAEMICQGLQGTSHTRFLMVRFGNVLGSSGSVIPKFREQIAKGGPITVTHPEITRYFMSIPEAAQLVLQAGLMGQGGEIFVLDMGESIRIVDLAREMIRLSGFTEDEIKIIYSGLRPGEKLYEELLADDEHTLPTPHPKLRIAQARKVDEAWVREVVEWIDSADLDEISVKQKLQEWVSEYQPAIHQDIHMAIAPGSVTIH